MSALADQTSVLHAQARRHFWEGDGLLSIKTFEGGQALYRAEGGTFRVGDGQLLVLNHAQPYSIEIDSAAPVTSFCVFFSTASAAQAVQAWTTSESDRLDEPFAADLSHIPFFARTYQPDSSLWPRLAAFRQSYAQHPHDAFWLEEAALNLLDGLLGLHQQTLKRANAVSAARFSTRAELYRRLWLAREFIHACYAQPLTLQAIADTACLSPNHLLRSFKALFGLTPYQYLIEQRLEHAHRLLLATDWPVLRICLEVGYESPASFTALFQRRYGCSPSALRRQTR